MAQGPVELWLGELLMQQQSSLHTVIKASDLEINDEEFDLLAFLNKFQAQVRRLVKVFTTMFSKTPFKESHCNIF